MPIDYYKILGIDYSATEHEIKSAFRNRVKKYHPDTNCDKSQANSSIIDIYDAYKTLANKEKRKIYDAFLTQRFGSQKTPRNKKIFFYRKYKSYLFVFLVMFSLLTVLVVWKTISETEAIDNTDKNQKEILKENTPKSSQEIKF